ncbi:MAG: Holliday junction branch migration protein RuvA [Holosporales bacterium]|jgi:Holliday junction DNA helicase RuvA|nr:Holliday junction branch migration protein RuvA [Holosporales bacterium]
MIAKLHGVVDSILDDSIILDVHGVGFQIFTSSKCRDTLKVGDDVNLRILHIFKQENQVLCGFQNDEEIGIFKALLDVQGVGIKSSLSVLSTLSIEEIAMSVINQDSTMLCRAEGIGKKTAARILLELKDKTLPKLKDVGLIRNGNIGDAILGLISLGFQKNGVIKVVGEIVEELGQAATANQIIVHSLKKLN